jgi:hypothetical protein
MSCILGLRAACCGTDNGGIKTRDKTTLKAKKPMNHQINISGISRRSFIKRSVVAAVAVSSMSVFSGLVSAVVPGATGTETTSSDYYKKDHCVAMACGQSGNCAGSWYNKSGNAIATCQATCSNGKVTCV